MGTGINYFGFISSVIQLWTATIIMVAASVLHLSTMSTTLFAVDVVEKCKTTAATIIIVAVQS